MFASVCVCSLRILFDDRSVGRYGHVQSLRPSTGSGTGPVRYQVQDRSGPGPGTGPGPETGTGHRDGVQKVQVQVPQPRSNRVPTRVQLPHQGSGIRVQGPQKKGPGCPRTPNTRSRGPQQTGTGTPRAHTQSTRGPTHKRIPGDNKGGTPQNKKSFPRRASTHTKRRIRKPTTEPHRPTRRSPQKLPGFNKHNKAFLRETQLTRNNTGIHARDHRGNPVHTRSQGSPPVATQTQRSTQNKATHNSNQLIPHTKAREPHTKPKTIIRQPRPIIATLGRSITHAAN